MVFLSKQALIGSVLGGGGTAHVSIKGEGTNILHVTSFRLTDTMDAEMLHSLISYAVLLVTVLHTYMCPPVVEHDGCCVPCTSRVTNCNSSHVPDDERSAPPEVDLGQGRVSVDVVAHV
jgi:hypothetical protein